MDEVKYISSVSDLFSIRKNDHIKLTCDIDCEEATTACFTEIFRGRFDGGGFTIRNLILTDTIWGDEQRISLFNYLSNAIICNVIFDNIIIDINLGRYTPKIAGLCVESTNSIIRNVTMSAITNCSSVPLIYETNGGEAEQLFMFCNGQATKPVKYM